MSKKALLILVVLLLGSISRAQDDHEDEMTIRGKVVSYKKDGTEEPIPGAKVKWKNDKHMALTKPDGTFEIHVHQLPDTLFIKFTGYALLAFEVKDPAINYTFDLKEGQMLNGVDVVAENLGKTMNLMTPTNIEIIGQDELRNKAACCNLSESFETNASVDVNMTDAVSGARKIQMLGLDGIYTQVQYENLPMVRGLSSSHGLNTTPGTWIGSIQITKGTGSVVNGYESMAGLINLELKHPSDGEAFYVNVYGNRFGRAEINIHSAQTLNDRWSTMTFAHFSNFFMENDMNNDGFRDQPIGQLGAFMQRWTFFGDKMESKFGVKANYSNQLGGQLGFQPNEGSALYNGIFKSDHVELFGKTGIFLASRPNGSIGLIKQVEYHHMITELGNNAYEGTQKKIYFNGIYTDIIGNTMHNHKSGISFVYDNYVQTFNDSLMLKTEIVPGIFSEYTYNRLDKVIIVAGVRGDYHNLYGPLFSPRLHAKWNINPKNALRISIGRGYRVPNPYADNMSYMASSRLWVVSPNLVPEDAISSGITYTQKFLVRDNVSSISVDYFYTHFNNQFVVDMDQSANELHLYNTNAKAYSHCFQAELSIKPTKGLELRAAYKYYDVRSDYAGSLHQIAFVPKFRALFNAGYITRNKKWTFDVTGNWIGKKRLPSTATNPLQYQRGTESERYWLVNSQVTYKFKKFSFYVGGENLLSVIQDNAIISADDPFGPFFDATQLWAPIMGANIYAGFHFGIKQKSKDK